MVSSVELLRGQHVGIDLFGKFIEQTYDVTDLLFFLFARSAVNRVLEQGDKKEGKDEVGGESKDEAVGQGKSGEKPKKIESKYVPQDIRMTDKQMYQAVKQIVDPKKPKLREEIIRQVDYALKTDPEQRKTLEPDRLLAIATEAYHFSRDLEEDGRPKASADGSQSVGLNADGMPGTGDKTLPPEIRKEVRQVTQRLVSTLSANGEKDVNPQDVYEWALQVTLRRHKVGEFLEKADDTVTSMDLGEMQDAALGLIEQEENAGVVDAFVPAEEVLNLSPDEFEDDLEGNVRQLLLNATSEVVGDAIASLPVTPSRDERTVATIRSVLIAEFAPVADILMECIVSKDYKTWNDTLKIDSASSSRQRQQFEKLHDEFQQVLNSDITAALVQQICRAVVSSDELYAMVRDRTEKLASGGKSKKLGATSSDDEGLNGTASFGEDAF